MKINVQRVGGIWHGTLDDYPDVDVRALTEDVAGRKVEEVAKGLAGSERDVQSVLTPRSGCDPD
jgi:hypothetical protein